MRVSYGWDLKCHQKLMCSALGPSATMLRGDWIMKALNLIQEGLIHQQTKGGMDPGEVIGM